MFVGEFDYRVDEKGRVPIPPPFRHDMADGIYLTDGADGCIAIYTQSRFQEIAESLTTRGLPKKDIRNVSRTVFSNASHLKPDSQGRVMLPHSLRQRAGIQETAVIVGVNEYAEIWNPNKWQTTEAQQDQVWQIIETLQENDES